jgi:hypothetical protein
MKNLTRGQYGNPIHPVKGIYVGGETPVPSQDGWMDYEAGCSCLKSRSADPENFTKPAPQGWVSWDDDFGWGHTSCDGNGNDLPPV